VDIKDKLAESKIKEAEAKIATQKIRRDAAYRRLVAAQKSGASADARARFAALYDRAEERLEEAEDATREAKRRAMGLSPSASSQFTRVIGQSAITAKAIGGGKYEAKVRRGGSFDQGTVIVRPLPSDIAEYGEELAVAMAANRAI
jgi:hypothetical protein